MTAWNNVLLVVEVHITKIILGAHNWTRKLGLLPFSQVSIISFS